MANGIKLGNNTVNFKVGSGDCKVYLGNTLLYPTAPPSFQGKWLATYNGGTTSSAECDASSAITKNEITLTDIVSVEIGDCVTTIGDYVFDGCESLTSIDIPDSVTTIGHEVFQDASSITALTIPSGVTSIGFWAFSRMTNCQEVTFENPTVFTVTETDIGTPFHDWYPSVIYVPDASVYAYRAMGIDWWIDGVENYPDINTWIQPISNKT